MKPIEMLVAAVEVLKAFDGPKKIRPEQVEEAKRTLYAEAKDSGESIGEVCASTIHNVVMDVDRKYADKMSN